MHEVPEPACDHDLLIAIKTHVESINVRLNSFVTHEEFWPVKMLVYGAVGIMCAGIVGAVMTLIIRQAGA